MDFKNKFYHVAKVYQLRVENKNCKIKPPI